MAYNTIKVEPQDQIIWLTLNRPERLNAISHELLYEMIDFFEGLRDDNKNRIVIIKGEGRAFCAGTDLKDPRPKDPEELGKLWGFFKGQERLADMIHLMLQAPHPLIAAVRGPATGGGLAIALACDMRIAGESALFQVSFIRRGFSACDCGSSYFLPRLIGLARASELLFTGRFFDASTADKIGLVSKVVPDHLVEDAALELAKEVMQNAPIAVRMTKEVLNMSVDAPGLPAALHLENRTQSLTSFTEDQKEAVKAFLEKREPVFKNR
jgi:enoyl-CoA hydratase/carnithine racemase